MVFKMNLKGYNTISIRLMYTITHTLVLYKGFNIIINIIVITRDKILMTFAFFYKCYIVLTNLQIHFVIQRFLLLKSIFQKNGSL